MPAAAGPTFPPGSRPPKTIRRCRLCLRRLPARSRAIGTARFPTSSCSTAGWCKIIGGDAVCTADGAAGAKVRRLPLWLMPGAGLRNWAQSPESPTAPDIVRAAADTAIDSSARSSFTALDQTMSEWRASLVRWRCGLSATDRQNYGAAARAHCRDLKFFVGCINFEQLGSLRALALNSIATRFRLSQGDVETLIAAGRDGLRTIRRFTRFSAASTDASRPQLHRRPNKSTGRPGGLKAGCCLA